MRYSGKSLPIAAIAVAALTMSACAETGERSSGSGAGVEFGASMEEYQAAFEDVSPITIHAQSPNAMGSTTGRYIEEYHAAVEEWSGGKITFDVVYSSGIASPVDADVALADGRLDISQIYPSYEPQEYPASSALIQSVVQSDLSVVEGVLATTGWGTEVAANMPELAQEYEDKGMKLLVPFYIPGANAMYCREVTNSLDTLQGAIVAVGGASQVKQMEAIKASPVSMPFTEHFEGLQRGVADCVISSLNSGANSGLSEVAANVTLDPSYPFAPVTGTMAMSLDTWDSLPLIAQQLLHDRIDVFLTGFIGVNWEITADASRQVREAGGSFVLLEPDARDAVEAANAELVESAAASGAVGDPSAFIDTISTANDEWTSKVTDLGYANEVDFNGFGEWYQPGKIDLTAFMDALFEENYSATRPGASD